MRKWAIPVDHPNVPRLTNVKVNEPYDDDDAKPNPRKESLLRRSLDLAKGARNNGDAIYEIVSKGLDAGLYDIAIEGIRAYSPKADDYFCMSLEQIFSPKNWNYLSDDFATFCEERLLSTRECRAGVIIDNHQPDNRSCALGKLGLYHLAKGDSTKAFQLWQEAADRRDIDEAIAEVALAVAESNEEYFEIALSLVDLINTKSVKAKALAELSDLE